MTLCGHMTISQRDEGVHLPLPLCHRNMVQCIAGMITTYNKMLWRKSWHHFFQQKSLVFTHLSHLSPQMQFWGEFCPLNPATIFQHYFCQRCLQGVENVFECMLMISEQCFDPSFCCLLFLIQIFVICFLFFFVFSNSVVPSRSRK